MDRFDRTTVNEALGWYGVRIANSELLERVFTHDSYIGDGHPGSESNEELEFLGDAVLGLIVSEHLFNRGIRTEGKLTKMRSSIVRNANLVKVAGPLKLGEGLRLSRGELKAGGRQKPHILSGCFEALVAALYLDQGFEAARSFVDAVILNGADLLAAEGISEDSKSRLNEYFQKNSKPVPVYRMVKQEGPDHSKTFEVAVYSADNRLGAGKGKSKQEAEEDAAKNALELIGN